MASLKVVNKHHLTCTSGPDIYYIGRGSALGNPYPIGPGATREQVVQRYAEWLNEQINQQNPSIIGQLESIANRVIAGDDIRMVCYCAPKLCHGDIIKATILNAISNMHHSQP